jgi:hypothetical protein
MRDGNVGKRWATRAELLPRARSWLAYIVTSPHFRIPRPSFQLCSEVPKEEVPMSDLAKWKVHGPVHILRIEFAEWDLSKEEWQAPRSFTLVQFFPNRRITES